MTLASDSNGQLLCARPRICDRVGEPPPENSQPRFSRSVTDTTSNLIFSSGEARGERSNTKDRDNRDRLDGLVARNCSEILNLTTSFPSAPGSIRFRIHPSNQIEDRPESRRETKEERRNNLILLGGNSCSWRPAPGCSGPVM